MRRRYGPFAASLLLALGLVACAQTGVALPPDLTSPREILARYLTALAADDCDVGHAIGAGAFADGSGDLCGKTDVTSFAILGEPAQPIDGAMVFTTHLVTSGTGDGTVTAGGITWFFNLQRTATGDWRIFGAGSGP